MRMLFITSLICLVGLSTSAQQVPPKAAPRSVRHTVLTSEDGNPVVGVRLARADVKTIVHGDLCQATMTLTFANDQPRVLGGNLVFPLPEGATVTGYGLDINGQMIDGVAVEKERARIIYESEIHKRVDPGLVEHVEGNAFRTRLYPIPANGTRSIKIEYVTQVEQLEGRPSLALPLGFGDALDELSIRFEAPEATAAPLVKAGGVEGLAFEKAERGFIAVASAKKARSGDELIVALPDLAERSVAVERRAKLPRIIEDLEGPHAIDHLEKADAFGSSEHYFVVSNTPAIPQSQSVPLKNHHIGLVWDASLSRANADTARELKLLESVLNHLGNPMVDLIVLRNDVEVQPFFDGDAAGTRKLLDTIGQLPCDGATALGSLIFPRNVADYPGMRSREHAPDYDLFLLFTDGFGNLGADRPLRAEVPVYAMSNDVRANHSLLRSICQESGGSYFNLKRASDEQVIAGIGTAPFSLVSVECDAKAIAEVYPPAGTQITGRFTVSGKLLAPEAKLTLHYGFGRQVVASQTLTISAAGEQEGSLLPRFWAQQKVAALSLFPEKNADELTRIGRQFNLVTPNTSLLVLESAEQYVQYRVVPPITQPEIYKQFLVRIEQNHAQEAQSQQQKLDQVAAMWNARVQWWEQEHKYPADLKVNAEGGKGAVARDELRAAANPAPQPASDAPVYGQGGRHPLPHQAQAQAASPARPQAGEVAESAARDDATRPGPGNGERMRKMEEDKAQSAVSPDDIAVAIKTWDPHTPYIEAMKVVAPDKAYGVYLVQRKNYATSPAFYFDCADYLVQVGQRKLGIRVLTDIVELELHDARLLRVAAHRLNQIGERELAIELFEKVLKLRPEEPQSYRDLALALADRADAQPQIEVNAPTLVVVPAQQNVDRALSDDVRALELLNKVVLGNWPRFPEVELPVLMEANDIAAKAQRLPGVHDFHNPLDVRLQKNLDLDVRVAMTWDADQTDIDFVH